VCLSDLYVNLLHDLLVVDLVLFEHVEDRLREIDSQFEQNVSECLYECTLGVVQEVDNLRNPNQ
jgi:FlaA1/EpsC-like NDP-sugar epimerase